MLSVPLIFFYTFGRRGYCMISSQVIKSSIDELKAIAKVDLSVWDLEGKVIAATFESGEITPALIAGFAESPADSQVIGTHHLMKVLDEEEVLYILDANGSGEETYMLGKIAVSQLQHLILAYKERYDRNNFFQNLLLDNMLLVDIYNKARKLHIEAAVPRAVFLIETDKEKERDKDSATMELLNGIFSAQSGDFITAVDESSIILIKELEAGDDYSRLDQTANTIVDMMNMEAMMNVRVSYGTIVGELKEVSKSYKEARMAMDVGKIFYAEKKVSAYNRLGIGRLIYQLPINLCRIFINEIFGSNIPGELDDETLITINKFFENNLNVSETSRQLFVHRNTLVYRIEKLAANTGLDIRTFEDALTFKIALMVVSYMKYLDSLDY